MHAPATRRPPAPIPAASRPRPHAPAATRRVALVAAAGGFAVWVANGEAATSLLLEYRTRAVAIVCVAVAAAGFWVGVRRQLTWGFELVPAAAGVVAATALVGALAGTSFAPGGLSGDQTFRTAAVTRFADSWHNADFTAKDLPSFYPPAYFWALGRFAAVFEIEPWRMLKVGAVVTALVVPMLAFVMWRRVVSERIAALAAVVPLVVENFYEPYSWLVIVAFVPWWLEVACGLRRPGQPPGSPMLLGAIGALMLVTYWYFFTVGMVALAVKLALDQIDGRLDGRQLRTTATVSAVTAVLSAWYWLPLVVSVAGADHPESLGNRWFSPSHPDLPLPMLDPSPAGVICLAGIVYLAFAYRRDAVARGLTVLLAGTYAWYLIGALAAEADHPLLTFRAKPLIPTILLTAGLLAIVRLADLAAPRLGRNEITRVVVAVGVVSGVYAAHGFIDDVRDSSYSESARAATPPDESPPTPSAAELQHLIESRVGRHAVLLSGRIDVLALYPNHAFVAWDAHYAHPASEFGQRIDFLTELARSSDPSTFRRLVQNNPYDTIDAFVLAEDGDDFVFTYGADAFPAGTRSTQIRFPKRLFAEFDQFPIGDHIVAIPD